MSEKLANMTSYMFTSHVFLENSFRAVPSTLIHPDGYRTEIEKARKYGLEFSR